MDRTARTAHRCCPRRSLTLISSLPLRAELERVLHYPKLAGVFADPDRILTLLDAIAELVEPTRRITVLRDEPDNRVLEAAVTGQAEAIVTGDAELLALGSHDYIPILTARELLHQIAAR